MTESGTRNQMNKEQFKKYATDYNVIPIYETITADLLTPVLAYLRIREKNNFNVILLIGYKILLFSTQQNSLFLFYFSIALFQKIVKNGAWFSNHFFS